MVPYSIVPYSLVIAVQYSMGPCGLASSCQEVERIQKADAAKWGPELAKLLQPKELRSMV